MEDEEVAMTPAYKALLDEVRAAIDAEDRKRLIKVVQQMQDSMMMELDNMRPTVRAKTGIAIFEGGNKAASDALLENIEFLYCDMDDLEVTRPEDLKAYLKKAEQAYAADPDLAESDEDFYGGVKVE